MLGVAVVLTVSALWASPPLTTSTATSRTGTTQSASLPLADGVVQWSGRVADGNGRAVPHAAIRVIWGPGVSSASEPDGSFTVSCLRMVPELSAVLAIEQPQLELAGFMLRGNGDGESKVCLTQTVDLTGRVIGENGTPINRGRVTLDWDSGKFGCFSFKEYETDSQGRYSFHGVPSGHNYRVMASDGDDLVIGSRNAEIPIGKTGDAEVPPIMVLPLGSGHERREDAGSSSASASSVPSDKLSYDEFGREATMQCGIPVVYEVRFDFVPLDESVVKDILKVAEPLAPQGQKVWYIQADDSSVVKGRPWWHAKVFYTPTTASDRIRKGKSIYLDSNSTRHEEMRRANPAFVHEPPRYSDYVQVSLPEKPFGKRLTPPRLRMWPFEAPEGLNDTDIIEIVDLARAMSPVGGDDGPEREIPFRKGWWDYDGKGRILGITHSDDVTVEVTLGCIQGPMAGQGETLRCVKKDGRWVVLGRNFWIS